MKKYSFRVADIFDPEVHYISSNWILMTTIIDTYRIKNILTYIRENEILTNNNISCEIRNNIRFIFDNLLSNEMDTYKIRDIFYDETLL